jgi:CBS domain-containing protein
MQIQEIMTKDPKCCTPDTNLKEVAKRMVDCDCGEIPIVNDLQNLKPLGVVTDRDIVCRTVAQGKNPLDLTARDCMTSPAVTVKLDTSAEDCCTLMQKHQVRRVLVVDQNGRCCGVVSQADLACKLAPHQVGEVVKQVSQQKRGAASVSAPPA